MSDNIALKHLIHYLEAHRLQQRLHRPHLTTFLSPVHKKHSDFQQLNHDERLIEYLNDRKAAEESLNQKLNAWLKHYYHPPNYHDSMTDHQIVKQNSEYFHNLGHKYPDYPEEKQPDEMNSNGHFSKDLEYRQTFDVDRGRAMEESVVDTFHKYIDHNPALGISLHHEGGRKAGRPGEATEPEFTYEFDNSNLEEKHPFAVAPNDPRYYDKAPFSSGKHSR